MFRRIFKITMTSVALFSGLCIYAESKVPPVMNFSYNQQICIESLPVVTLNSTPEENRTRQVAAERGTGIYTASLFGVFPLKEVAVIQSEQRYVSVSGKPFGIKMFCDGVMLVGFSDILTRTGYQNPAKTAGLKTGDVITHINDKKVQTNEDVERIILKSGVSPLKVSYIRDDTERTAMLMAVKDSNTGALRTGMWVRDSGAGIGTMTFFDSITGCFGGLGHGIKDVDTQKELRLLSGEIVPVKITGIVKSKNGSAGQLKGSFLSTMASGKVLENGKTGVYGRAYTRETDNMMPVATPGQIKTGKAYILTTISGTEPHMYEVEIEKVNLTANDRNKNMVIRITDSRLLSLTGGIVAGMSGSPIIQDGMLVGAVTHVFVNQVERGYAIFAQNMLETMDSVAEAKKYIA